MNEETSTTEAGTEPPELQKTSQAAKPKKKSPYIMSEESAEEQIEVLLEHYEVNFERKFEAGSDELLAFNSLKSDMVEGIRRGKISFDDENGFAVVQKLQTGTIIKYKELDGNSKVMMGKYKSHTQKVYALLAAMSGDLDVLDIRLFKGPDNTRAELIGNFLLLL